QCFGGVTEASASFSPTPGEWSAKEVLAHLILGERETQVWIDDLIGGAERWTDIWGGNNTARNKALVAVHPTIPDLLQELRDSEAETVALLSVLPTEFMARKGS